MRFFLNNTAFVRRLIIVVLTGVIVILLAATRCSSLRNRGFSNQPGVILALNE
ncbi:MAG: hypothetical protein AAGU76_02125 [Sedimentibacter sp.]|uniref:hypothetical protein n=1 Tax=Sedimentibacter sp. TaxID=1960295 RepID=UPI00315835F1